MRSFKALNSYPKQRFDKLSSRTSLVHAFRLKHFFTTFKSSLSDEAAREASLITEHLRSRYFTMWRHHLHLESQEKELESSARERHESEMQRRIFGSMRMAMQRARGLKESEERVREMGDTRRMREVISRLNNMREVRAMREQAIGRVVQRIE